MTGGAAVRALAELAGGEATAAMDERAFADFYGATARAVRGYLFSACGDPALADDLVQETYLRWLRADTAFVDDEHRRRYLFKIAGNLLKDHWRRRREVPADGQEERLVENSAEDRVSHRADVARAMSTLAGRDRQMLWLAYVEGSSHDEIAGALGLKTASIKSMLSRARSRLARSLRELGLGPVWEEGE